MGIHFNVTPAHGWTGRMTLRHLGVNCCENGRTDRRTVLHKAVRGVAFHSAHMRIICQPTAEAAARISGES